MNESMIQSIIKRDLFQLSIFDNYFCITYIMFVLCFQLKHCSKQVHDILIPLIKNMEIQPVQHLLQLVSSLEPVTHTEQVQLLGLKLYLIFIKGSLRVLAKI